MTPQTATELLNLVIDALKVPHIAVLVGMLGIGAIFVALVRVTR